MLTSEDEDCVLKIGDLGLCRGFRANAGTFAHVPLISVFNASLYTLQ